MKALTEASILLLNLLVAICSALTPYNGSPPSNLPDREPFGFASLTTGGAAAGLNATYLIDNMPDLRTALTLPFPKVVYINGTIKGNDLYNNGTYGDCQLYINTSPNPQYNFTLYLLSFNETYMDLVRSVAAANGTGVFEGRNATEYLALLDHQNGWRQQVQDVQKDWELIAITNDTSVIGFDENAFLDGVEIQLSSVDNVIIRNLKLQSPRDCFPAPETFPATWNARYKAVASITSTNIWLDGNTLQDGDSYVLPDPTVDGWLVDHYDGLFDVEDGSDNITFSHNIVRNHHKSMLLGGGNAEGYRDLGKMRFTFFGNLFNNSDSRNPLMRFGTFLIYDNLYMSYNNKAPLFNATLQKRQTTGNETDTDNVHEFEYNWGIYNDSNVLTKGNVFKQTGTYPNDITRIVTFEDVTSEYPAVFCAAQGFNNTFNGVEIDIQNVVKETFEWWVENEGGSEADGGLEFSCDEFEEQTMPVSLGSAEEVEAYVMANAGQTQSG